MARNLVSLTFCKRVPNETKVVERMQKGIRDEPKIDGIKSEHDQGSDVHWFGFPCVDNEFYNDSSDLVRGHGEAEESDESHLNNEEEEEKKPTRIHLCDKSDVLL